MALSESDSDDRLAEVVEEMAARFRRGERPEADEYTDRYPEQAEAIRGLFETTLGGEPSDESPAYAGDTTLDARATQPVPRQVGDYRIVREIGRGGMGVVYEAEQISLSRRVALKVLAGQASRDPTVLERFRREARAAARLHHTNIVPVFEVGQDGETRFYAMQFIQGLGLDALILELRRLRKEELRGPGGGADRGRPSPDPSEEPDRPGREPATLREEVGVGPLLQSLLNDRLDPKRPGGDPMAADEPGPPGPGAGSPREADRPDAGDPPGTGPAAPDPSSSSPPPRPDVSPPSAAASGQRAYFRSLARLGQQVAGGLAYAHARGIVHRDIKPSNLLLDPEGVAWITDFGLAKGDDEGLTETGDILGTFRYMAPERFRGEGDARADVYALGMTLYELLTLRAAFRAKDRLELIEQIKTEEPPRPRSIDRRIPRDLETIVLKAIEKEPGARYPSAEAMGEDLRRFLADEPILARQVSAPERYWRWARRNPTIAVLGAVLTALLLIATASSFLAARWYQSQAEVQSRLADAEAVALQAADRATASLLATQRELRNTVYSTRSNLALSAWDSNEVGEVRSLLDLMRPAPREPDPRGWEWRYLFQLAHDERRVFRSGQEPFLDVAFSPDGQTIAGLEARGRIHLWDRKTGALRRLTGVSTRAPRAGLAGGVGRLAFSPDGKTLAGPGPDQNVALYSVETGQLTLELEGQPRAVLDLAWSPDGRSLVAAQSVHVMRIWNTSDGRVIHDLFGRHGGPVAAVAYSPDGRTIVSGSYDRTVKMWSLDDPAHPRAVLEGHSDEVRALAFSPDGQKIASAGLDRTIRIWDARSGAPLAVISGPSGAVLSLAFLPGGKRVVTGGANKTVRVWDIDSGRELGAFKGHVDAVVSVAVSRDGRDLASASDDGTIRIWDAARPPRPRRLESDSVLPYGGVVECLAFSPDGGRLVSGHDDNALRIWELPSGRLLHVLKGHTRRVECVAFSPDGQTIVSAGGDRTARSWDAATGKPRKTFTEHTWVITGLLFSADGRTIFSGGFDNVIHAWDPETGAVRYTLTGRHDRIHDLALSPDEHTLASVHRDGTGILWDLRSRRPRAVLEGHRGELNSAAFSPDGRILATSSDDHTIRIWDSTDGALRGILQGHLDEVYGLAFSPDGRLASSSWDKTIRIWDVASRQTLLILDGHKGRGPSIRFSPDGRTLATAGDDRCVKLWDAAPLTSLASP